TPERLRIGDLPPPGRWVRLEVPVARLKLLPGTVIDGWAFTQHDGSAYWDEAGIATQIPQDGQRYDSLAAWIRAQRALDGAGLPEPLKAIVRLERSKRTEAQTKELLAYFVEHADVKAGGALPSLRTRLAGLEQQRKELEQ